MIGQRILNEALERGHQVTAVLRNPKKLKLLHKNLKVARGDVFDPMSIRTAAVGSDAILSSFGPNPAAVDQLVESAKALINVTDRSGIRRLVIVGGAGSLEVAPGVMLMDTPEFPAAYLPYAEAHKEALAVMRLSDLDWTVLSPAAVIEPGERTGRFRLGSEQLIADANGASLISAEDFAIAMLDEVEKPQHIRARFTLGY